MSWDWKNWTKEERVGVGALVLWVLVLIVACIAVPEIGYSVLVVVGGALVLVLVLLASIGLCTLFGGPRC